jgi:hypothetical protein
MHTDAFIGGAVNPCGTSITYNEDFNIAIKTIGTVSFLTLYYINVGNHCINKGFFDTFVISK